jgi:hypothetical protein
VTILVGALPFNDPALGYDANVGDATWGVAMASFLLIWGCPTGFFHLMHPGIMSLWDQTISALVAALGASAMSVLLGAEFGIYPIPFRPLVLGVLAAIVTLVASKHILWHSLSLTSIRDCFGLCLNMVSMIVLYNITLVFMQRYSDFSYLPILVLPIFKSLKRQMAEYIVIPYVPDSGPLVYLSAGAFHSTMMVMILRDLTIVHAIEAVLIDLIISANDVIREIYIVCAKRNAGTPEAAAAIESTNSGPQKRIRKAVLTPGMQMPGQVADIPEVRADGSMLYTSMQDHRLPDDRVSPTGTTMATTPSIPMNEKGALTTGSSIFAIFSPIGNLFCTAAQHCSPTQMSMDTPTDTSVVDKPDQGMPLGYIEKDIELAPAGVIMELAQEKQPTPEEILAEKVAVDYRRSMYRQTSLVLEACVTITAPMVFLSFSLWALYGYNSDHYLGYKRTIYSVEKIPVEKHMQMVYATLALTLGGVVLLTLNVAILGCLTGAFEVLAIARHTLKKNSRYVLGVVVAYVAFAQSLVLEHSGMDYSLEFLWLADGEREAERDIWICIGLVLGVCVVLCSSVAVRAWKDPSKAL